MRVVAVVVAAMTALGTGLSAVGQVSVGTIRVVEPRLGEIVTPPFAIVVANAAAPGSEEASQVQLTIDGRAVDAETGGFVEDGTGTFFGLEAGERREIVVTDLGKGRHELGLAVVSPGNPDPQVAEPYAFTVPPQDAETGQLGFVVVLGLILLGLVFTRRRLMSRRERAE